MTENEGGHGVTTSLDYKAPALPGPRNIEVPGTSGEVFKEHGALSFVERWGDDVPDGNVASFPMAVNCKPDETVVFSWIIWSSRELWCRDSPSAR